MRAYEWIDSHVWDNSPLSNQTHLCKSVTIYNARNRFCVILNLDDFNLAERVTTNLNNFQLHFAGIIILYAATNSRSSHVRRRRTRNDIIISLSSSKRAKATASRCTRANLFVATLSYLFDVPSLRHSRSHVEIVFQSRNAHWFRISKCREKWYSEIVVKRHLNRLSQHIQIFILEDAEIIVVVILITCRRGVIPRLPSRRI